MTTIATDARSLVGKEKATVTTLPQDPLTPCVHGGWMSGR